MQPAETWSNFIWKTTFFPGKLWITEGAWEYAQILICPKQSEIYLVAQVSTLT